MDRTDTMAPDCMQRINQQCDSNLKGVLSYLKSEMIKLASRDFVPIDGTSQQHIDRIVQTVTLSLRPQRMMENTPPGNFPRTRAPAVAPATPVTHVLPDRHVPSVPERNHPEIANQAPLGSFFPTPELGLRDLMALDQSRNPFLDHHQKSQAPRSMDTAHRFTDAEPVPLDGVAASGGGGFAASPMVIVGTDRPSQHTDATEFAFPNPFSGLRDQAPQLGSSTDFAPPNPFRSLHSENLRPPFARSNEAIHPEAGDPWVWNLS